MNTAAVVSSTPTRTFLRRVLMVDAATCVATGALLVVDAQPLSSMLGLAEALLRYAGISLFPVAAFILWVATRFRMPAWGVWLVILGNLGWVIGSAALVVVTSPTMLGYAFVVVQAVVVAALAELEFIGLRRSA